MTEQYIEELIEKISNGTAKEDEIRRLNDWYRNSTGEAFWISPDPDEKQKVYNRMLGRLRKEIHARRSPVVTFSWSKAAAILVLVLGITALMVYYKPFSPAYLVVTNPSGKIQNIQLPDGSQVSLNASSTLRYAKKFTNNRILELTGEGYFNVTHDPSHPFTVKAGDVETTVLGTSFNVKAYPSLPKTTISVISGRVKVTHEDKELGQLSPTDRLEYDRLQQTAGIARIDTNKVMAWTKGKLQFEGDEFSEIAAALENWYGVTIVLSDPGIGSCRYYMTFDHSTALDSVLKAMSAITEMQYSMNRKTNTITISGRACH